MTVVKKYNAEVINVEKRIEGVYTVEFKSLSGPFKYQPGQFLHLALDEYDPSSGWPESRCFSMQSPPYEDIIRITYAIKGTFTTRMSQELKPDRKIWLKLPYGDLFLQDHSKINTIFLAGGTGITPFLSLFTHSSFASYQNPHLYLGLRSRQMNIYNNELIRAKVLNPEFITEFIYQDEQGFISIDKLIPTVGTSGIFFISGPPAMIKEFKERLIKLGISSSQIKTDDWA